MLMLQELQTRILNIRYVLKHPNLSEVQRARFLHLLGSAETDLLEFMSRVICEILFMEGRTMINIEQT